MEKDQCPSRNILYFEDCETDAFLFTKFMGAWFGDKYKIRIEPSYKDNPSHYVNGQTPDVVISDYNLNGSLNGLDLLKSFREHYNNLPLILLMDCSDPARRRVPNDIAVLCKSQNFKDYVHSIDKIIEDKL